MAITVYVDESGDHSLTSIDPDFPVFVLVMFIVQTEDYCHTLVPKVYRLKHDSFGHECVPFHSIEIRKKRNAFAFLNDQSKHADFMSKLNDIMTSGYTLVACAINKTALLEQYGTFAGNPYDLALEMAIEALMPYAEAQGERFVHIFAESRGNREDKELEATFHRIVTYGNSNISPERFKELTLTLTFRSKYSNVIGMELADLAAYPIARYVIDSSKVNLAFDVLRPHFYRGLSSNLGLRVFIKTLRIPTTP